MKIAEAVHRALSLIARFRKAPRPQAGLSAASARRIFISPF